MSIEPQNLFVAVLIATGGLWWFNTILKSVRTMAPVTRYGVYVLIWLSYFVAVLLLIHQTAG